MSGNSKAAMVGTMWFSVAVMEIAITDYLGFGLAFVLPLAIACLVTIVVGIGPALVSARATNGEKAKRRPSDALAALMELMDEDEREEFKERLKRRVLDNASRGRVDGELPLASETLESLLGEEEAKYKHDKS